jgi:hypothetical protein
MFNLKFRKVTSTIADMGSFWTRSSALNGQHKIYFTLPERELKLSNAGNLQLIKLFLAPWLSVNSSHYLNQQFSLRLKTSATHCIIPEKGLKITILKFLHLFF